VAVTDSQVARYWELVVAANRDRLANPGDADLIYPGQTFVLPPLPSP
jgi:nucleoid-associated protein YgaU